MATVEYWSSCRWRGKLAHGGVQSRHGDGETALWRYLHWFNLIKNICLSYRCGWWKPFFGTPLEILLFRIWIINSGQKWHGEGLTHYLLQIHTSLHKSTVIYYYPLRFLVYIYCISSIIIMVIISKLKIAIEFFFSFGATAPILALAYLCETPFHFGLLDLRHSVRLLGGWSARRKRRKMHTHMYKHWTSMPWVGFDSTSPASERAKTVQALDFSATVTGHCDYILEVISKITSCPCLRLESVLLRLWFMLQTFRDPP
jgi:hypothetical protein